MTHVHDPVISRASNAEIAASARNIHPLQFLGRLVLTTILVFFTSIGWVVGASWFAVVFSVLWSASHTRWCFAAARYGYLKGSRTLINPKE